MTKHQMVGFCMYTGVCIKMPRRRRDEPAKLPENVKNIVNYEDIYAIINYVQVEREQVSFVSNHEDSIIIETLLKDSEIPFNRKDSQNGIKYHLRVPPKKEIPCERFVFDENGFDEYPDEIIEKGQCF